MWARAIGKTFGIRGHISKDNKRNYNEVLTGLRSRVIGQQRPSQVIAERLSKHVLLILLDQLSQFGLDGIKIANLRSRVRAAMTERDLQGAGLAVLRLVRTSNDGVLRVMAVDMLDANMLKMSHVNMMLQYINGNQNNIGLAGISALPAVVNEAVVATTQLSQTMTDPNTLMNQIPADTFLEMYNRYIDNPLKYNEFSELLQEFTSVPAIQTLLRQLQRNNISESDVIGAFDARYFRHFSGSMTPVTPATSRPSTQPTPLPPGQTPTPRQENPTPRSDSSLGIASQDVLTAVPQTGANTTALPNTGANTIWADTRKPQDLAGPSPRDDGGPSNRRTNIQYPRLYPSITDDANDAGTSDLPQQSNNQIQYPPLHNIENETGPLIKDVDYNYIIDHLPKHQTEFLNALTQSTKVKASEQTLILESIYLSKYMTTATKQQSLWKAIKSPPLSFEAFMEEWNLTDTSTADNFVEIVQNDLSEQFTTDLRSLTENLNVLFQEEVSEDPTEMLADFITLEKDFPYLGTIHQMLVTRESHRQIAQTVEQKHNITSTLDAADARPHFVHLVSYTFYRIGINMLSNIRGVFNLLFKVTLDNARKKKPSKKNNDASTSEEEPVNLSEEEPIEISSDDASTSKKKPVDLAEQEPIAISSDDDPAQISEDPNVVPMDTAADGAPPSWQFSSVQDYNPNMTKEKFIERNKTAQYQENYIPTVLARINVEDKILTQKTCERYLKDLYKILFNDFQVQDDDISSADALKSTFTGIESYIESIYRMKFKPKGLALLLLGRLKNLKQTMVLNAEKEIGTQNYGTKLQQQLQKLVPQFLKDTKKRLMEFVEIKDGTYKINFENGARHITIADCKFTYEMDAKFDSLFLQAILTDQITGLKLDKEEKTPENEDVDITGTEDADDVVQTGTNVETFGLRFVFQDDIMKFADIQFDPELENTLMIRTLKNNKTANFYPKAWIEAYRKGKDVPSDKNKSKWKHLIALLHSIMVGHESRHAGLEAKGILECMSDSFPQKNQSEIAKTLMQICAEQELLQRTRSQGSFSNTLGSQNDPVLSQAPVLSNRHLKRFLTWIQTQMNK